MTPLSFFQLLKKIIPAHYAVYFGIFVLSFYVAVDQFIYDLSPIGSVVYLRDRNVILVNKIDKIEKDVGDILSTLECKKGGK